MRARRETRDAAIRALNEENRRLWARIVKADPLTRDEMEVEYAANIRRVESIEGLGRGEHQPGETGVCAPGAPRCSDDAGVSEDWRVRVNGVLDSEGQFGLFQGECDESE